jgi:hypothetical protein
MAEESETIYNYELLDKVFSMLDTPEDLFPILTGYFNKVVLSLLNK